MIDDCRDVWNDAQLLEKRRTLPALLQSLAVEQMFENRVDSKDNAMLSEAQIQSRDPKIFTEAGIPEAITDILLEWRRRALESLHRLKPFVARNSLENILDDVMAPK